MEIDFDKLIQLQDLDSEIKQTTLFLESIPRLIEEIDRKIKAGSQAVADAKEKLSVNQKTRRDLEASVKDVKVQIGKFKRQLGEVKTNKEYTALLKEIEESQHEVDAVEEKIISEMLAADDIDEEIKSATRRQNQEHEEPPGGPDRPRPEESGRWKPGGTRSSGSGKPLSRSSRPSR